MTRIHHLINFFSLYLVSYLIILKGCHTLDDVKEKVILTKQQQIGLKHYDDFLDRIPRNEVKEIGEIVSTVFEVRMIFSIFTPSSEFKTKNIYRSLQWQNLLNPS